MIGHSFIGMHQPRTIGKLLERLRPVPMLAYQDRRIGSPLDIAQGRADAFLLELNRAIAAFGASRVRPPYARDEGTSTGAFNRDGSARGHASHCRLSQGIRADLAARPRGSARTVNAALRKLGEPGVTADLPDAGANGLEPAGIWESPHPGELRERVLPADAYVDVVANDLYDQRFNAAGRERGALRIPPEQALRDRRVGPLGNRRPAVRGAHGRFRAEPSPGGSSSRTSAASQARSGTSRPSH